MYLLNVALYICWFVGEWKDNEKDYIGNQMKVLLVDVGIKFKDFLRKPKLVEFDFLLRYLYNVKPFIYVFVISNQ